MRFKTLIIATLVGVGLQVALVVAGHVVRMLQDPGFAIGGMAFSAIAGWLYARMAGGSWGDTFIGGARRCAVQPAVVRHGGVDCHRHHRRRHWQVAAAQRLDPPHRTR
ncbi:MAG: hypothetical protein H7267_06095 [Sandarakinorhabdus sp.]|nr:hypothetical protein [Sandarakinorhabdus sp.]